MYTYNINSGDSVMPKRLAVEMPASKRLIRATLRRCLRWAPTDSQVACKRRQNTQSAE